jgi:hypothetical protein
MLDTIEQSHFEDLVGQNISIDFEGSTQAEVVSVKGLGRRGERDAFSVLFRSGAQCPQGIYTVHHPTLGEQPLFLVPLGPDGEGMLYEAVFS